MTDDLVKRLRLEAEHDLEWASNPAEVLSRAADRIEELEARLARAVEALNRIQDGSYGKNAAIARANLEKLKGQDDE